MLAGVGEMATVKRLLLKLGALNCHLLNPHQSGRGGP